MSFTDVISVRNFSNLMTLHHSQETGEKTSLFIRICIWLLYCTDKLRLISLPRLPSIIIKAYAMLYICYGGCIFTADVAVPYATIAPTEFLYLLTNPSLAQLCFMTFSICQFSCPLVSLPLHHSSSSSIAALSCWPQCLSHCV